MRFILTLGVAALACALPAPSAAQAAPVQQNFLAVGTLAPDFTLPGATRYGVLQQPVRLSDYRGDTVVLAFFYRVRGGG
jgi:peroxiredoxin Q/BCP